MLLKRIKNIMKKDLVEFVGITLLQILNKYYTLIMFIVKKVAIKRMNYLMRINQKFKWLETRKLLKQKILNTKSLIATWQINAS